MASIVMSEDLRRSRLLSLMDGLVTSPRDIVPESRHGLTLWQTNRMHLLQSQWLETSTVARVYEAAHSALIRDLPSKDDYTFNNAQMEYWDTESAAFYLAGYRHGEQVAMVDTATRRAIAIAFAADTKGPRQKDWGSVVREATEEDPWESAAEWAANLEHDSQFESSINNAKARWIACVASLEALHPERKMDLVALNDIMTHAIWDLRGRMFHEGCLDGETVGSVRNVR